MSERPESLAERIVMSLDSELAAICWPSPAEIRARARRRVLRASIAGSVAAAVAVAAVVLGVAAPFTLRGAVSPAGPAVPPSPVKSSASSSLPSTAVIPPEALLQPEDVGPGLVIERVSVLEGGAGYYANAMRVKSALLPVEAMCPAYQRLDLPPRPARYHREQAVQRPSATPGHPERTDPEVFESVVRLLDEATAAQVLDDVRLVLRACARYVSAGPITERGTVVQAEATHEWDVLDDGFTGTESMIVRHTVTVRIAGKDEVVRRSVYLSGYVRVGDLVAILTQLDGNPERARELAVRAAHRLCVATVTC